MEEEKEIAVEVTVKDQRKASVMMIFPIVGPLEIDDCDSWNM
jgi:hypothetical protein